MTLRVQFYRIGGNMDSLECEHIEVVGDAIALFNAGRGEPRTRMFLKSERFDASERIEVWDLRFLDNAAGRGAPVSWPGYATKRVPQ